VLSVVIPTLGRATLREQLTALASCSWSEPWEILVVDNGSGGAARAICDEWGDRLPYLRHVDGTGRPGRSYAVNCGARAADGRWLLFCDDDDVVVPDFVSAVGDAFMSGARAVAFNFNVREVNPRHVWQSYRYHELEHGRPMFRSIPALWGCAGIERELFLDLGGFDEGRPYAEDLEFSVRLHGAGVEPTWLPRQLLHYRLRSSVRARFAQRVQIVCAVQAVARRHPDVAQPVAGRRWARLFIGLAAAVPALPKVLSRRGRLEYADRLGDQWGLFVAQGLQR
jgi:glycosyltransferase involved in cell wall biosynthesis